MQHLVVMLLFTPFDFKNLVETQEKGRVATMADELLRPAREVSVTVEMRRMKNDYLAGSFRKSRRSFLAASISSCMLDAFSRRAAMTEGVFFLNDPFLVGEGGGSTPGAGVCEREALIDTPRT